MYQPHITVIGEQLWSQLRDLAPRRSRPAHSVLLRQGNPGTHVILLDSGSTLVTLTGQSGERTLLAVRGAGELLGELAVLGSEPRSASSLRRRRAWEDLGSRPGMASSYHQLGTVAQAQGRLEDAEDWYRKALTIDEEVGNRPGTVLTFAQLGLQAEAGDDTGQALVWAIKCVALFDAIPHPMTGMGPVQLRRLTRRLGIATVENAWQQETGNPLPGPVRAYVLAEPDATDTGTD
ncbi:cyclic nucleotide-binding domain-containing protein [Streptomyces sp. NPDC028722]|uniref:cyclic nucleotide-binding domain-containing protein n=1 Tax=Streptomyces sp. NPDC028722 TaxID=3155016 RepID=UPI0034060764